MVVGSCTFSIEEENTHSQADSGWILSPFEKVDAANPCLLPSGEPVFYCPVRKEEVHWEVKDVFNPAVIVRRDTLLMIYRAEDSVGRHAGTSRLGLAWSVDGLNFNKRPEPIFYPDNDHMQQYEWEGGCEDPRIVKRTDGLYVMTYTAYDGVLARLCVASSRDLGTWTKHGLAFQQAGSQYTDLWSKSGAIVSQYDSTGDIIAHQVNDRYWMYWGDKSMYAATSQDLIHWTPLIDSTGELQIVLDYRPGMFDSDLVEPGPPALLTDQGIVLIYNSRNFGAQRDTLIPDGTYSAGQALFSVNDPAQLVSQTDEPFFIPDKDYEIAGQVNRVVFLEGLVQWKETWFLYYGTADSKIAVAKTAGDQ